MKTRNGFVSNSSSSSFIVLFNHKPNSIEDLKEMMFKEWNWLDLITGDSDHVPAMTVKNVVERVFNDIHKSPSKKDKRHNRNLEDSMRGYIAEIDNDCFVKLNSEHYNELYEKEIVLYQDFSEKYGYKEKDLKKWTKDPKYKEYVEVAKKSGEAYKKYMETREEVAKNYYEKFRRTYKYHKFLRVFEYGDRYGEYVLEHGEIFRNLPHITISNH